MQDDPEMSSPHDSDNELLTATDVAAFLRVSLRTFNRLHLAGEGPPHLRIGRQRRWRRSDVEAWIASGLRTEPSPTGDQA